MLLRSQFRVHRRFRSVRIDHDDGAVAQADAFHLEDIAVRLECSSHLGEFTPLTTVLASAHRNDGALSNSGELDSSHVS